MGTILLKRTHVKPISAYTSGDVGLLFRMQSVIASLCSQVPEKYS